MVEKRGGEVFYELASAMRARLWPSAHGGVSFRMVMSSGRFKAPSMGPQVLGCTPAPIASTRTKGSGRKKVSWSTLVFGPMQEPQKMADGNWIMSGVRVGDGQPPAAVAISHGDDLTQWGFWCPFPSPPARDMWGESGVVVDGRQVPKLRRALVQTRWLSSAVSEDYGRNWTESLPSNLPMATAKALTVGVLSTGQRYPSSGTHHGGRRQNAAHPSPSPWAAPAKTASRKIFRIRDFRVSAKSRRLEQPCPFMSYPYAIETRRQNSTSAIPTSGGRRGNHNSAETRP